MITNGNSAMQMFSFRKYDDVVVLRYRLPLIESPIRFAVAFMKEYQARKPKALVLDLSVMDSVPSNVIQIALPEFSNLMEEKFVVVLSEVMWDRWREAIVDGLKIPLRRTEKDAVDYLEELLQD